MLERASLCWCNQNYVFYFGGYALATKIHNEIYVGKSGTLLLKALIITPQLSVKNIAQIQNRLSRHDVVTMMGGLRSPLGCPLRPISLSSSVKNIYLGGPLQ